MHSPIRAFTGFLRNEKDIYLLEFHVIWRISLFSLPLKGGYPYSYRGLHLYFLSPWPAPGCADKDLGA